MRVFKALGSSEGITRAVLCELCKETFSGVSVVAVQEREVQHFHKTACGEGNKSACCSSPDALKVGCV